MDHGRLVIALLDVRGWTRRGVVSNHGNACAATLQRAREREREREEEIALTSGVRLLV